MNTQRGRPRLLQVVHHLDLGGSEEIAISLAEHLHDHYDTSFFAVNGVRGSAIGQRMKERLGQIDAPVHSGTRMDVKQGGFLQAAARLAAVIWRLRPDLIHLHTESPELTYLLARGLPASGHRTPRVARTIHNTRFWGPWTWMGAQVERRLSHVPAVACSQAALGGLQAFRAANGLNPLAAGQTRVIYNGVQPAPARLGAQRPPGPLRVMVAGRLEPQKGVDLLPAILAQASALGHPAAELSIYGSGSLEPSLRHWAGQPPAGWTVRVLPPTPQLRGLMAQHDLLLMPSRFEGLPLIAAEALMAGLPVIGTRAPGMQEVFPDGYPLLAASEDTVALGRLLAAALQDVDTPQRQAQAWAGPTADRFGVARMGQEYHALYEELLAGTAAVPDLLNINQINHTTNNHDNNHNNNHNNTGAT